jgi:peptidoglycan/LPS O-acetylase OafA/YrhL
MNEKNNFDFLRFILAFIVVLGHISILSGSSQLFFLYKYLSSYIAVSSFFIISGFLVTQSFIKTNNTKKYFIKRARRLLPAYFSVIFLCAISFSLISDLGILHYLADFRLYKYLICNLLFLNFLAPDLPGVFSGNNLTAVNGALWTIKIEVSFYLVVPILIYLFNRTSRKYILFIIIYLLSVIYQYGMGKMYDDYHFNLFKILAYQLPGNMSFFISGICLVYYLPVFLKYQNFVILPAIGIVIFEYLNGICILLPASLACIIFYIAFNFRIFNGFGKYGDFSYGIYIYHFPIVQLAVFLGLFSVWAPWYGLIIMLGLIILAGFLSWHGMEKRFLKRRP